MANPVHKWPGAIILLLLFGESCPVLLRSFKKKELSDLKGTHKCTYALVSGERRKEAPKIIVHL